VGGVNEVVSSLIRCFREGGVFRPQLLVPEEARELDAANEAGLIKPFYFDVWSPVDHQHPIRALLSFIFRFPYRCWCLRRIIIECDIKVINPHFPNLGSLAFLLLGKCHLFKGKVILSFHGSDMRMALSTRGFERTLWKVLLRGADHIVVVSDDLGKDVLALESSVREKVRRIYNGVDITMFAPPRQRRPSPLSVANPNRTIISVGKFIQSKGHDVLVRAFSQVLKEFSDARLLLVGQAGPDVEGIRQLIDSLSLADRVEIVRDARHEEIPAHLSRAGLYASASRSEGFPLAVLEAAASGLPVVCTRAPGLRELIEDGLTGRVVEVDDVEALGQAINHLLAHPQEAQRMATNLQGFIRNHLTWQHAYRGYLDLVGECSEPVNA